MKNSWDAEAEWKRRKICVKKYILLTCYFLYLPPSPSFPSPQGRTQNKMRDVYDPGSRPSPDLKSAAALILDFQPSEQNNDSTYSTYYCCVVAKLCPTLCDPTDCSPPGSSVHGISPGKNTGVSCHALLQGIFPTRGSNPGLPHCRWILYCLSHQGSPL